MPDSEQVISAFLESFPTYYCSSKPERSCSSGRLLVFSNKDEVYENSYLSDDAGTRTIIYKKIISAFSKMDKFICRYGTIVQLWAPVTIGGKHLLSTSGQPFAVNWLAPYLKKYREHCVSECRYDIDVNSTFRGTPASVFLNRFPEIVLDTKNHHESSLMRYASDCKLYTSYTLPIGCPQYPSSCIGVVECSSLSPFNLEFVNRMKRALEQEGLNMFNVHIPYNDGLTRVRDEIQVALKSVFESHKIDVAQVWIYYEDENHVPFSFSSGDTQTTRRLALKLTGHNSFDEDPTACHLPFKEYCDACDMVPLKMGKELVGKTLQDYQPRFCENISQLGTDTRMAWVSTDVVCSGFTICMSIDTGDFSCAFEFIWHHNPNYFRLLKKLLLTLESHLPRFKFASGAELDQLDVTFVQFFNIYEKRTTKEITLSREDIEQHYGKTEKQAAKELDVSLSTLKRKCKQLGIPGWQGLLQQKKMYNPNKNQGNESQTHQKDIGVIQDPSPVERNVITAIKAQYADDTIRLHLPPSDATFVTVENEIVKEFELKHGTFKICYLDEDGEWILMKTDQHLNDCIKSSRNINRGVVRLRVRLHNQ